MDEEKKEDIFSVLPQWIELGSCRGDKFPVRVASDKKTLVFDFELERETTKNLFRKFLNESHNYLWLDFNKKKGEEIRDFLKHYLGEYPGIVNIDIEKGKGIPHGRFFGKDHTRIILIFDPIKEFYPRVSQELFDVLLTDLIEPMEKKRNILKVSDLIEFTFIDDRKKNIKLREHIKKTLKKSIKRGDITKKHIEYGTERWLNQMTLQITLSNMKPEYLLEFPPRIDKYNPLIKVEYPYSNISEHIDRIKNLLEVSYIKNEININLTEEEYIDSIKGTHFKVIASKDDTNAAKAEIIKAIEEIAESEHVELKNETKKELANLSIVLLKKLGEGIQND